MKRKKERIGRTKNKREKIVYQITFKVYPTKLNLTLRMTLHKLKAIYEVNFEISYRWERCYPDLGFERGRVDCMKNVN